jgi:quercetin dioxygenase-like cupin family protein
MAVGKDNGTRRQGEVEKWKSGKVEMSNCQIAELSNFHIFKLSHFQIVTFSNLNIMEFEKATIFNLAASVDYSGNATVSKMVIKKPTGSITLFAFDKDQSLSEHSAPFDAYVLITEGKGRIIINQQPHDLVAGEFIVMPANIPHAVQALEAFKMMLVMIKG